MEKKIYRTRYGVGICLLALAGLALAVAAVYERQTAVAVVIMVLYLAIIVASGWCYYVIDGDTLVIHNSIVRHKIDIHAIRRIEISRSWLSAPAASLRRIRIIYSKYDDVLVSPVRQDEFIKELLKVNPDIVVEV